MKIIKISGGHQEVMKLGLLVTEQFGNILIFLAKLLRTMHEDYNCAVQEWRERCRNSQKKDLSDHVLPLRVAAATRTEFQHFHSRLHCSCPITITPSETQSEIK